MANNLKQGVLTINSFKHPEKYIGKQKDNIVFRSSWELSFMKYCDRNPNILKWSSEEIVIKYLYSVDKRWHRYFPDFYIQYISKKDGKERDAIVEIKPYAQTKKPILENFKTRKSKDYAAAEYIKNMDKWRAAKLYAKERKMKFIILTENDIEFRKLK
jgi:deoxyxylulose-5-phosphate synthase